MPELPEPGSEEPPDHMSYMAEAVNEAQADYERRNADLERYRERLEDESGEPWRVEHFGFEFSENASAEVVGVWDNGDPMWVISDPTPPAGDRG